MSDTLTPSYLSPGDMVAVVAPAGRIDPDRINGIARILESWQLKPVIGTHAGSSHGYFAGKDQDRLSDLQKCIDDPSIKAIFCIRGGYGITRILDNLNLDKLKANPKWVVGFSDVTAFLLKLHRLGLASVHGIMPVAFDKPEAKDSIDSLQNFLFGQLTDLKWETSEYNRTGESSGILVGGNLSLLVDSLGTSNELISDSCILFLEEIGEYSYKIDRMMTQLKRSGKLDSIKALLIGHFTDISETSTALGFGWQESILEKIKENIPVAFGLPVGHDFPNLPLPVGKQVHLKVDNNHSHLSWDL